MVHELTVSGFRQTGKTELLLRYGLDEASRGRSVLYESQARRTTRDSFARARKLVEDFINMEKVILINGQEEILFDSGGRLYFGSVRGGMRFDTHISDQAGDTPHITAERFIRSIYA